MEETTEVIAEVKRGRGRPKKVKDPSIVEVIKPKGKRGRPKKEGGFSVEEKVTFHSTPKELKQSLAKKYLEMAGGEVSNEVKEKYYAFIDSIPMENFRGSGWEIYKSTLNRFKNENI